MRSRRLRERAVDLVGGRLLDAATADGLTVDELREVLRDIERPFEQRAIMRRRQLLPVASILLALGLVTFIVLVPMSYRAGQSVREGKTFHSNGYLGIRILTIHADRASIDFPNNQDSASKTFAYLRQRSLLYIGQNNGTIVLYEGDSAHRAIYLPASAIVLTVDHDQ